MSDYATSKTTMTINGQVIPPDMYHVEGKTLRVNIRDVAKFLGLEVGEKVGYIIDTDSVEITGSMIIPDVAGYQA